MPDATQINQRNGVSIAVRRLIELSEAEGALLDALGEAVHNGDRSEVFRLATQLAGAHPANETTAPLSPRLDAMPEVSLTGVPLFPENAVRRNR
jgi:hypothetical protein